jgi:hypothetical protein
VKNSKDFELVERLIFDESGSLYSLAVTSGIEPFFFYRGADLRDLNLSDQNLAGLNFQGADLRGANLDGITYTLGAFNGSKISPKYIQLVDEFDSYIEDVLTGIDLGITFFGRMRAETLEAAIAFTNMSYGQFCEKANINQLTLRRARREHPIASTTLKAVCELLGQYREKSQPDDLFASNAKALSPASQPFIQLLTLHGESGFRTVPSSEFAEFLEWIGYLEGKSHARFAKPSKQR